MNTAEQILCSCSIHTGEKRKKEAWSHDFINHTNFSLCFTRHMYLTGFSGVRVYECVSKSFLEKKQSCTFSAIIIISCIHNTLDKAMLGSQNLTHWIFPQVDGGSDPQTIAKLITVGKFEFSRTNFKSSNPFKLYSFHSCLLTICHWKQLSASDWSF